MTHGAGAGATDFRDVHATSMSLLQATDTVTLWQTLLGDAIGLADGHGGSFWLPDDGLLKRIMVGGDDGFGRQHAQVPVGDVELLASDDDMSFGYAFEVRAPNRRRLGIVRITRARDDGPLDDGTREGVNAAVEVAAATALMFERHAEVQARAKDFALVAEMSREVTATLDLDRVLRAVVNLAARALTFDRGAVALYEDGNCDIRAVAGADTIDPTDARLKDLAARAAWAAGRGEGLYVSDRDDPGSDAERVFLQFFAPDLEADGMRSGVYLPLRDEEGIVGILVLEAARPEFANEHQREVAGILANQATVAIRNARLYSQLPMVDVLGAIGERRRAFRALPRERKRALAISAVLALLALTLVRWPLRVDAADPVLLPTRPTVVRAQVDGQVEAVLVATGQSVHEGDPLLRLRNIDRRGVRAQVEADIDAALRDAALAASRGDPVGERLARLREGSARERLRAIDAELGATIVRAPADGTVLTERPYELVDMRAAAGAPLLVLGRTDSLEVEFALPQRDVARVAVSQRVRLRVDALPQRTFEGRLISVAPLPATVLAELSSEVVNIASAMPAIATASDAATFPARAVVANPDGALRPGMRPQLRVLTAPASLAERMLRAPMRAWRLLYWRLTA
jgi:GAF domain-containing protein